ncbi:hypothetical protein [Microbulbifer epialgicus]|uniref:Cytochrome oxidase Cu insertion factor, SCO1/SenC/PrrC family n=1 Tax=Microbulbifer epialgicus TaxID=393907 RepID=A0ABV4NU53_9GAMM
MEKKEQVSIFESAQKSKSYTQRRRLQGISIVASVLLPIAAAYIVFYTGMGMPSGTINQGELIQPPVKIDDFKVTFQGKQMPLVNTESPKWRYLIFGGEECGYECEKLLYTSRQVHIRLGEKANRVERLLITGGAISADREEQLKSEHPRLRVLQLNQENIQALQELTAHQNVADIRAVLIDQKGFAMMAYDNHHSGNQLLKDIKRLLRYSYDK